MRHTTRAQGCNFVTSFAQFRMIWSIFNRVELFSWSLSCFIFVLLGTISIYFSLSRAVLGYFGLFWAISVYFWLSWPISVYLGLSPFFSGCLRLCRAPTLVRIFGNGPNLDYSLKISLNLVWICSESLIFSNFGWPTGPGKGSSDGLLGASVNSC